MKHGCPRRQQCLNMAKISKSYILTPPHPQGHVMSVKCEEPIDELTVQVWLLFHDPNFKYCTLFVSRTELRTDRQTDGQTDDPITRCPRRTFQAGGIKIMKLLEAIQLHYTILYSNVASDRGEVFYHHNQLNYEIILCNWRNYTKYIVIRMCALQVFFFARKI